jgi:hypothetical protein
MSRHPLKSGYSHLVDRLNRFPQAVSAVTEGHQVTDYTDFTERRHRICAIRGSSFLAALLPLKLLRTGRPASGWATSFRL